MATSVAQNFYKDFREAVRIRTTDMAVPVSGGLDSTLIVKALVDNQDTDKCLFLSMGGGWHVDKLSEYYGIDVIRYEVTKPVSHEKLVDIWEEPFYSLSPGYHLYEMINKIGKKVSMSGLGSDELFGGYDYYGNSKPYPRGLLEKRPVKRDGLKSLYDRHLLQAHHLRKNDKLGLHFQVEGRYPYLDKNLRQWREDNFKKKLIKDILREDLGDEFVDRKKEGFRLDSEGTPRDIYFEQLKIWFNLFT